MGPVRHSVQPHVRFLREALREYQFSATVNRTSQPTGRVRLGRRGMELKLVEEQTVLVKVTLDQHLQLLLQSNLKSEGHGSATDQHDALRQILSHVNGTAENGVQDDKRQSLVIVIVGEQCFESRLAECTRNRHLNLALQGVLHVWTRFGRISAAELLGPGVGSDEAGANYDRKDQ